MEDIVINSNITIPATQLRATFSRSSGPGGQNVNKVNSKVDLRWQLSDSQVLTAGAKRRLKSIAGSRLTNEGEIQVVSDENRDQISNLRACRERLKRMVIKSLKPPTVRKKTKPSKGSIRRRLKNKKVNSEKKKNRSNQNFD
jgi:ribosome-associated protein